MTDCTITRNAAVYGGGVRWDGPSSATLADCTIMQNAARTLRAQ